MSQGAWDLFLQISSMLRNRWGSWLSILMVNLGKHIHSSPIICAVTCHASVIGDLLSLPSSYSATMSLCCQHSVQILCVLWAAPEETCLVCVVLISWFISVHFGPCFLVFFFLLLFFGNKQMKTMSDFPRAQFFKINYWADFMTQKETKHF